MLLESLLIKAKSFNHKVVAVVSAENEEVIEAVKVAIKQDLARFKLYGNKNKIEELLRRKHVDANYVDVIPATDPDEASRIAVNAILNNEATILMKGNVSSAVMLKAVLDKEAGLRIGDMLSHVSIFEVPGHTKPIIVTDAAINLEPDLHQKQKILQNAVRIARRIGIESPKVAVLAPVEVVNTEIKATVDAALLTQMNKRGQIKNCIVDGPLAFDNAISLKAAHCKEIYNEVAGSADILLVPSMEVGNVLYKTLVIFSRAKVGAIVTGGKVPIVLTSRSDTYESKLYSLALAICLSER